MLLASKASHKENVGNELQMWSQRGKMTAEVRPEFLADCRLLAAYKEKQTES